MQNLAIFFQARKSDLISSIGAEKANAVVTVLNGMAETQRSNQAEIGQSIAEQANIVNDALAMHFAAIDRIGIDILLEIAAGLPLIKGDRTRLMQVLLGILKNSIEGIEIEGGNKTISLKAHFRDGLLILEIRDTGIGFGEVGSRIFNRGFTTKTDGAGLALYNCRAIVESHAGTIAVNSDGTEPFVKSQALLSMTGFFCGGEESEP